MIEIKTILLGEKCVGKTQIINNLRSKQNNLIYTPTIGVDYYKHDSKNVSFNIWDTSLRSFLNISARESNVFKHSLLFNALNLKKQCPNSCPKFCPNECILPMEKIANLIFVYTAASTSLL
ncbi:MAG TPA: hypothetical protein EYO58_11910 [Flavobacteriales bacterium]|nr:hypothetical protein [Flavobacteriales bacterium]